MDNLIENIRKYRSLLMFIGGALLITLIVLTRGGDEPGQPLADLPTTTQSPGPTSTSIRTGASSEVPPIDCDPLLTFQEILGALGALDNEELGSGSSGLNQGETCTETLSADEDYFVRIGPGSPDDFEPDTQIFATSGDPDSRVGDEALWFGGPDAEGGGAYGVIVVREETQHGLLHFRVLIGRPDVDEAAQRDLAIGLAKTALPRFPGVEIDPPPVPEPELAVFDEGEPLDRSVRSLADNLLAREEEGDWSRGEGLVLSLGLMAGEVDTAQVLGETQLLDQSATLVILLAREYLQNGDDQAAKVEIERLLDRLTLSREELDNGTGALSAAVLRVSYVPIAEADDQCEGGSAENPCYEQIPLPGRAGVPPDKFALFVTAAEDRAWTSQDIEAAKRAILDSAAKFEPLGQMPETTVVLQKGFETIYLDFGDDDCVAHINEPLADVDSDKFQQIIAREMAFCFVLQEFTDLIRADLADTLWWRRGLITYLSGYVYPLVNLEHENLPTRLAGHELTSTLPERGLTNWVLFEYLHSLLGVEGNLATIGGFPVGGDHVAALAAFSDTPELFHDFERALTDANVPDLGPGTVPYEPRVWEIPLTGPTDAPFTVLPFGVKRILITVPEGLYGCFETFQTGEQKSSWRRGAPGEPGSWDEVPPAVLEGETTLVVTAVKPGAEMTIEVTDVSDDPDCEEQDDGVSPPTTLGDCGICGPSQYYSKP